MRLEILVDHEDPQIFPLKSSKITLGSHESCDIQLPIEGISRKHLQVICENDNYYVVDQGSTNGSYINEERLVPGRRSEFTSFFPVRLGDKVLLTLLSDEEAHDLGLKEQTAPRAPKNSRPEVARADFESTKSISLRDLQSQKTEKLVKRRHDAVKKRKVAPAPVKKLSREKRGMLGTKFVALVLVSAAGYYQYRLHQQKAALMEEAALVEQSRTVEKVDVPRSPPQPIFPLVDKDSLTSGHIFESFSREITCTNDLEASLCRQFGERQLPLTGVLQVGTMINLLIKGNSFFDRAREAIPVLQVKNGEIPSTEAMERYQSDLKFTAMILFLKDAPEFDLAPYKDFNLTFALVLEGETPVYLMAAFVPEALAKFRERLKEESHFQKAQNNGAEAIYFLREYFTFY